MKGDALVSPCRTYRYWLLRGWTEGLRRPVLTFVMLNPSTADVEKDDPTIRKCVGFAKRLGYNAIDVVNLFALRATNPEELKRFDGDPVGPDNDKWISIQTSNLAHPVVVAWGGHGDKHQARVKWVTENLLKGRDLYCLGTTDSGQPRHPLMLPYSTELVRWKPRNE